MKWLRAGSAALVVIALMGCESFDGLTDLEVTNQNAADRERVLQTWADNQNFILGSFQRWYAGGTGYLAYPAQELSTMGDEQSNSWGNYDSRVLSSEPRVPFNNSPSYTYNNHAEYPWYFVYESLSNVYDGIRAINNDTTGLACIESDCDMLQAFAKFLQGLGHGSLALFFDSAFVLDETVELFDGPDEIPQVFVPYHEMRDSAISYFDQAITLSGTGTWQLPDGIVGLNGNNWTGTELAGAVNAAMAHMLPMFARTPAERDAVDWARVEASALAAAASGVFDTKTVNAQSWTGIFIEGDGADVWDNDYLYFSQITSSTTWNRADYKTIGQYDENSVAGNGTYGYVDWLNEATPARTEFRMVGHPDRRIMGAGDTDGRTDGLDFRYRGSSRFPSSRGTYHYSYYSNGTFETYPATQSGPMPWILEAGLELNRAEALMRGSVAGGTPTTVNATIVGIVNDTRVTRGGLPALTTGSPAAEVYDAIIYERRIENFGRIHSSAYYNRRGEGPLSNTQGTAGGGYNSSGVPIQHHQGMVEGSPLHFAPPGKELEVLELKIWTYGGVGSELAAGQGLASPPAYIAELAPRHSIRAFYIPAEESLQRRAEERNRTKSLVRYVQ